MRHYKPNIMQQKYYKQKQIANADSVNSLMRQWNTSCQHGRKMATEQYTKKLHFNVCEEIRVKLRNKHWHDHVTKSAKNKS